MAMADCVKLTVDQQKVVDLGSAGYNVLVIGCAGSGKSTTISATKTAIVEQRGNGRQAFVGITAPIGSAAARIGGATLHSFLGKCKLRMIHINALEYCLVKKIRSFLFRFISGN